MNSAFVVRGESACLVRREYSGAFTIMAGQRGARGASGGGSGAGFEFVQGLAIPVWTIPHNLNRFPSVTVVDSTGSRIEPDVKYLDANIIQITHGAAYAGKAYLN
ncbi:hypothetical protein LCG56_26995 [Pseudomonas cannabina pv. alisalensis]|uniref:Uncharacterized protein n=1 Tax=Pseudomonas syringae pv. maculicola str. ES4326 TaxID=629265 RepID=A0A8T8BZT4_PSEYM|nr:MULTISPECIES: hypothetical protein [Pseudomonas syringae group]QHE96875.1 hypothetical protein PMA4326_009715 [Pseudomonas syringae pv. maculicola str. ES4326]UBY97534.1 hypothetical protein LCG56_26995 [Pseudomonas cannabina pv. alisalensis]